MTRVHRIPGRYRQHTPLTLQFCCAIFLLLLSCVPASAQDLPPRYPMLELFTNTPCPICGNQNPGLFNRLANYEGEYHLVSFYPGRPYNSCIFYQANIPENQARWQFYTGAIFGTPSVVINGTEDTNSNGITTAKMNEITGHTSWLHVDVNETTGASRDVEIVLQDHVGGSLDSGKLFAVIVEKEIQYNAPNGETLHHNVFRKFLSATGGDDIDLSAGTATVQYAYEVESEWQADQTYVIAWLMDPSTKEIFNSGSRFDDDFVSSSDDPSAASGLHIYPNPSTGIFTIEIPNNTHSSTVRVYNATGALVYKGSDSHTSIIQFDGSGWPEGNYLVIWESGNKSNSQLVTLVK